MAMLSVHQGMVMGSTSERIVNHNPCRNVWWKSPTLEPILAATNSRAGVPHRDSMHVRSVLFGTNESTISPLKRWSKLPTNPSLREGRPAARLGCCVVSSLGFTADPRAGIERAANALLKDAATLLMYQEVLRRPPAQAFLKVLLALRRGDDGLKLLESYGEFFKLMAMGRYPSWEDYVLDGILAGDCNPFAEAAANLGNAKSMWPSAGVPASLQAAAASDLDTLQRLSITESTLSGWVTLMVADLRPEWRTAAASNLSCKTVRKLAVVAEGSCSSFGFSLMGADDGGVAERSQAQGQEKSASTAENYEGDDSFDHPFLSFLDHERVKWRKKIGGLWKWSEAVPMLEGYYTIHSRGQLASTQVMQWRGGKMARDFILVRAKAPCNLTIHTAHREALQKNLHRHASGSPAHHTLLLGPSGVGKSWLLNSVLSNLALNTGLRVVTLPQSELKTIHSLLEELARHWQLRFALIIDDLFSRGGEEGFTILKTALDGNLQEWPQNVLLCATTAKLELVHGGTEDSTEFKHLFGLVLHLPKLNMDNYLVCVQELLEHKGNLAMNVEEQAKHWLHDHNMVSVRSAAHFVTSLL